MRPLSPRERRLVAVAILIAIVAVIWLGVVSPVLGGFLDRSGERATLQQAYARNARIIDSIRIWKHQALAQERDAARYAFAAPNATIASQLLQQHVARIVASVGGSVVRSGPQEPVSAGTARVGADLQLTMSQLYQVLKRVESGEPYVVVEFVSVGADRAFQSGHSAPLDVRLRLAARFRPFRQP
jgi:hypothetical protein